MEKTEIIRRAIENGRVLDRTATYISVREVVMKLTDCCIPQRHGGVKNDSKTLLMKMAEKEWTIRRGPHPTDEKHQGERKDETLHITVTVKGVSYHLKLNAEKHIYHITDKDGKNVCGIMPWVAHGSYYEKPEDSDNPFGGD